MSARIPLPNHLSPIHLQLPTGDSACITQHGAQVLSWRTADGHERLYLSPHAVLDGRSAIRGGVPICWPQFNQRGELRKHGFARLASWRLLAQQCHTDLAQATLRLTLADVPPHLRRSHHASLHASSHTVWTQPFVLDYTVSLRPQQLHLQLRVYNSSPQPLRFTTALHSYLACDDARTLHLDGGHGHTFWNAVANAHPSHPQQAGSIRLGQEVDRVYPHLGLIHMRQKGYTPSLAIQQSASMQQTVIWNPGASLCQQLPDLPPAGWQRFVCIEAAQIDTPVCLLPGQHWLGGQYLHAIAPTA